jgi:hypothetical protein
MIRRFNQPIVGSDHTLTEPRDAADGAADRWRSKPMPPQLLLAR